MADPQNLRIRNRVTVLEHLFERSPTSRSEIAEALGLSKVTVTAIANELVSNGLLLETGRSASGAGRPANVVALHPKSGSVLGIDLQPKTLRLSWSSATLLEYQTPAAQRLNSTTQTQTLLETLTRAHSAAPFGALKQVVIGVPAPISPAGLPISPSRVPKLEIRAIQNWSESSGTPVVFENDIKLATIAEQHWGAARGSSHFALLEEREDGVALGVMIDNRLYNGERGRAGELALVRVPHGNQLVPLEDLPRPEKLKALAQLVAGFALVLDVGLLLVQTAHDSSALLERIRALTGELLDVRPSALGADGPLQGAVLLAARNARAALLEY